jgi:hypothetical protein
MVCHGLFIVVTGIYPDNVICYTDFSEEGERPVKWAYGSTDNHRTTELQSLSLSTKQIPIQTSIILFPK